MTFSKSGILKIKVRPLPGCTLFAILLFSILSPRVCSKNNHKRQKLMGAFIYRIAQFVSWPEEKEYQEKFTICIYGNQNKNLGEILKKGIAKKRLHGKSVEILQPVTTKEAKEIFSKPGKCQLVFLSESSPELEDLIQNLKAMGQTLLIGNSKEFIQKGGIISLVPKGGRIKLYGDQKRIQKSPLKFDSRLLKLVKRN